MQGQSPHISPIPPSPDRVKATKIDDTTKNLVLNLRMFVKFSVKRVYTFFSKKYLSQNRDEYILEISDLVETD